MNYPRSFFVPNPNPSLTISLFPKKLLHLRPKAMSRARDARGRRGESQTAGFFVFTDGSHICGLQDQLIAQGGTTAFVFQIKRYLSEKSRFSAVISWYYDNSVPFCESFNLYLSTNPAITIEYWCKSFAKCWDKYCDKSLIMYHITRLSLYYRRWPWERACPGWRRRRSSTQSRRRRGKESLPHPRGTFDSISKVRNGIS